MSRWAIAAACAGICLSAATFADEDYWTGAAERNGATMTVNVQIGQGPAGRRGALDLPDFGVIGIPLLEEERDGSTAKFNYGESPASYELEGKMDGDSFTGHVRIVSRDIAATISLAKTADPRPYTTEDVTFENGDVTLSGTVFVPKSPGPHPAIVLMHGSGDNLSWYRFGFADFFARQGLVALSFDKRGCGGSAGNWRLVGFDAIAQDGLAGLRLLQARPDVDPKNVGFWGISQAGWIMPLAASIAPDDVAFIITNCGAAVDVEEEGKYDYLVRLRDAGYSAEDLAKAERILDLDHDVTMTGDGYDELRELVKAAHNEPWWKTFDFQLTPVGARRFPKLIGGFDPRPILEQIDTPILWMYGDEDKSVESPKSIAIPRRRSLIAGAAGVL
jgi:pimeloyl-ACP methyl ester carboxylesterase